MKGLIPFSWDEVKVGDRIIPISLDKKYRIKIAKIEYSYVYDKRGNGKYMWDGRNWYIDRRPRYKRLFYNLFG